MKKIRFVVVVTVICAAAALVALPPGRAKDAKTQAKEVTFTEDVAPIFFKKCADCHRPGEAAPFSILSYKDVGLFHRLHGRRPAVEACRPGQWPVFRKVGFVGVVQAALNDAQNQ